jgi:hypothetical protein
MPTRRERVLLVELSHRQRVHRPLEGERFAESSCLRRLSLILLRRRSEGRTMLELELFSFLFKELTLTLQQMLGGLKLSVQLASSTLCYCLWARHIYHLRTYVCILHFSLPFSNIVLLPAARSMISLLELLANHHGCWSVPLCPGYFSVAVSINGPECLH